MKNILEKLESYDCILWDWNGTLLNDVDIAYDAFIQMAKEHQLDLVKKEYYLDNFRFPVLDFYKDIGFDITNFSLLSDQFHGFYNAKSSESNLYEDVPFILDHLKRNNQKQAILSAGSNQHLESYMNRFKLKGYFEFISGATDDHAFGKKQRGIDLARKLRENGAENLVMLGDTTHDSEVAHAMGVDSILLTGGHQSYKTLNEYKAQNENQNIEVFKR